jgi:hypothetical protein
MVGTIRFSWAAGDIKDYLSSFINLLKGDYAKLTINYGDLIDVQLKSLGFLKWDNDGPWLIPMWLFNLLPDDTKLTSPLVVGEVELKKDAETDSRFGCSAYTFYEWRKS